MRSCLFQFVLIFLIVSFVPIQSIQAQSAADLDAAKRGVILTKLHDPAYPPLARIARILGDVELMLRIKPDGTIESIESVRGPAMLLPAARESAQQSQFECDGCTGAVTPYSLVYSFQFSDGDCCVVSTGPPKISWTQGHVTVVAAPFCLCDPSAPVIGRKVRSMKCLYLWKCAVV